LSIALITVIASALASWFIYTQITDLQSQLTELQTQNSELQDQNTDLQDQLRELQNQLVELQDKIGITRDVNITAVEWIGGFNPVGGLTLTHPVKVTIENMGVNDVSGLTLTVKLLDIETGSEVGKDLPSRLV
jgi:hypothetical protein